MQPRLTSSRLSPMAGITELSTALCSHCHTHQVTQRFTPLQSAGHMWLWTRRLHHPPTSRAQVHWKTALRSCVFEKLFSRMKHTQRNNENPDGQHGSSLAVATMH
ncbi:uncharacterized protein LOC143443396 [Arvicanthis niloticus]|uniref:uncharacterized protein LOC143443396 n=1 Tax=Arvicanthis niloticus TaxID=61156 RepID=UPI00403CD194